MTAHLLVISLGPVQEFIQQARRTRDLWFGSHLLSELGRAAARALAAEGAALIFPALAQGHPELEPCDAPLRPNNTPPLSVPNKLLAIVPQGLDPKVLASQARQAARDCWQRHAGRVRHGYGALLASGIKPVWQEQIDTVLEFYASWAPIAEGAGGYTEARRRAEAALAARKGLRAFVPWRHDRPGAPKSSLDGARVSVLREPAERPAALVRRLRIAPGEQLDAVGLTKRAGGEPGQFVPISNIALAAWIEHVQKHAPRSWQELVQACRALDAPRVSRSDLRVGQLFGFDGELLLADRLPGLFEELGQPRQQARRWARDYLNPLYKAAGQPHPYVACLLADGDRMGAYLSQLSTPQQHRQFSQRLAKFSGCVRQIVEQQHRGVLVYAGGDDVLAFLPVPDALACAQALRDAFAQLMQAQAGPAGVGPTLSVGIGIGHLLDGMGRLRELARQAEQLAKQGEPARGQAPRNALAIVLDKRSGGTYRWRARWDAHGGDPVGRLRGDMAVLCDRLPIKKVHEIARDLRRAPQPTDAMQAQPLGEPYAKLLVLDLRRTLARAALGLPAANSLRGGGPGALPGPNRAACEASGLSPSEVGLELEGLGEYAEVYAAIDTWLERMLIARELLRAEPKGGCARRQRAERASRSGAGRP